jgi:sugar (pentulose or hexulose) kinase
VTRQAIAVLDVGKTNVKLLAISEGGEVLQALAAPARARDGLLDVDSAWQLLVDGLAVFAERHRLRALVPTTHGATAALIGDGGLVHGVVDYESSVPSPIDREYDALRPAFGETYSPRLPAGLNLGRQLLRIARERRERWEGARALLTYPQYWSWRLTGSAASEVTSLGCHTDLWRPLAGTFSSLVDGQQWRDLFPPRHPAWEVLGTAAVAGRGLPVLCGIHDSNAAYLRYLCAVEPPFVVVSTGTWTVCFNSAGTLAELDPARDTLANVDVLGRPVACARFMGGREYAAIAGAEGLAATPSLADARALVGRAVMALPSFAASGGPFPGRRGTLSGTPAGPGQAAALAALYSALMTRESIALTGPATRVYVDGPFASNAAFCALLAALLPDAEVWASDETEGTAVGASLLAHVGLAGALPRLAVSARRIEPAAIDLVDYAQRWRALAHAAQAGSPRLAGSEAHPSPAAGKRGR